MSAFRFMIAVFTLVFSVGCAPDGTFDAEALEAADKGAELGDFPELTKVCGGKCLYQDDDEGGEHFSKKCVHIPDNSDKNACQCPAITGNIKVVFNGCTYDEVELTLPQSFE